LSVNFIATGSSNPNCTEKGVQHYTLLNLGADLSFTKEQWPGLANRSEGILNKQQSIFPIDNNIEQSCVTSKAGGLKASEPIKAVENQEPPKGDC
jgi:hypothetical protein